MNRIILLFALLTLLYSCDKNAASLEPVKTGYLRIGYMEGVVNGKLKAYSPVSTFQYNSDSTIFLSLAEFDSDSIVRFSLSITGIPLREDNFELFQRDSTKLVPNVSAGSYLSDGDVFGSYYHLNESDGVEDYVEIRSYDKSTRAISGYLQASLYKDDRVDYDPLRPDTLVIRDGYFETIVQDRL